MKKYSDYNEILAKLNRMGDRMQMYYLYSSKPDDDPITKVFSYPKALIINPKTIDVRFEDFTLASLTKILFKPTMDGLCKERCGIEIVDVDNNYYYPEELYTNEDMRELLKLFLDCAFSDSLSLNEADNSSIRARIYKQTFVNKSNGIIGIFLAPQIEPFKDAYIAFLMAQSEKIKDDIWDSKLAKSFPELIIGMNYLGSIGYTDIDFLKSEKAK